MDQQKIRKRFQADCNTSNSSKLHSYQGDEIEQRKQRINQTKSTMCSISKIIKFCFLFILTLFIIVFVISPVVFRYSPAVQRMVLFMNYVDPYYFYNLSNSSQFGLKCTQQFRVKSNDDITLGCWHVFPNEDQCSESKILNHTDFNDNKLVVLYAHGNGGTRSSRRRVQLYKILSNQLDAHVITFDYRSYGDSSNVMPSTSGIVNDTKHVYQWILNQNVHPSRILLWGHSLGTAVVTRFLSEWPYETYPMAGVLEAPFTSVYEATEGYPLSKIYRHLPFFKYFFLDPIQANEQTNFNSTAQLSTIKCPLLIFHAKDDGIIPFEIGQRLYEQAVDLQPTGVKRAKFITYGSELGYGHKNIYLDPNLSDIVKKFIDSIKK